MTGRYTRYGRHDADHLHDDFAHLPVPRPLRLQRFGDLTVLIYFNIELPHSSSKRIEMTVPEVPEASFSAPPQTITCHGMVSDMVGIVLLHTLIINSYSIWSQTEPPQGLG